MATEVVPLLLTYLLVVATEEAVRRLATGHLVEETVAVGSVMEEETEDTQETEETEETEETVETVDTVEEMATAVTTATEVQR